MQDGECVIVGPAPQSDVMCDCGSSTTIKSTRQNTTTYRSALVADALQAHISAPARNSIVSPVARATGEQRQPP